VSSLNFAKIVPGIQRLCGVDRQVGQLHNACHPLGADGSLLLRAGQLLTDNEQPLTG
jgi:hypothetical protein